VVPEAAEPAVQLLVRRAILAGLLAHADHWLMQIISQGLSRRPCQAAHQNSKGRLKNDEPFILVTATVSELSYAKPVVDLLDGNIAAHSCANRERG